MATTQYNAMTAEDEAAIDAVVTPLCANLGEFARMLSHAQAIVDAYNSSGSAALTTLAAGNTAPNKSGLAGGLPELQQADIISCISHLESALASFNDANHRQLWVKFCGPGNMT